ncbi:FimV/HubP family polar landmark protein [Psychrobacter sp. P11G5]|uniref:FimV/HubP family polar landmark protein n=1 Tax=Psychrobacter sp. P11G5 TaxID=1699624 RepID=UPI00078C9471|nr:FimV/HubP family polar landmark protein [Psychrobacter sp. P11G5]AMN67834.1 hypothetical protein AK825_09055 [Psychrobacter sp. P11G5]
MDSMLYIIIGLVVVLLVAVLVLRKNKAQKSTTQNSKETDKNLAAHASTSKLKTASTGSNQNSAQQNATKFDPLAVAQRFMDQQRYDKAIESIERGLIEKPQDSKLLLKLLNIYAITNQHDDFTKTYNVIKLSDDTTAINDADQLKALLDQEQTLSSPVSSFAVESTINDSLTLTDEITLSDSSDKTLPSASSNAAIDHMSLDFNMTISEETKSESTVSEDHVDSNEDSFDLTLDDLATENVEVNNLESTTSDDNDFDITKETSVAKTPAEPIAIDDVSKNKNINVDDDFMLDFDLMSDDSNISELNFVDDVQAQDSQSQHISSDDDFVLELDDLVEETNSTDFLENSAQTNSEDFALLLESEDSPLAENSTLSMDTLDIQESTSDNAIVLDNDNVLENDVEDTLAQLDTTTVKDEFSISDDTQPAAVNEVSEIDIDTTTLFLDDEVSTTETLKNETHDDKVLNNQSIEDSLAIDDEFDFDSVVNSPSVSMPVESENNVSLVDDNANIHTLVSQEIDFAAQFATDFDFVNTLDSNQVTLDLAGQYLQLGEYDSAKRLLNEVITQGNSEQQNQAQEMLARTA